jgi:aminoglycoside phosphotransferase (APT) family kinase protein
MLVERIAGRNVPLAFGKPAEGRRAFVLLGELHAQLHGVDAPRALAPASAAVSALPGRIDALGLKPPPGLDDALAAVECGPAGKLLHGDFHSRNVLLGDGGPTVIDWSYTAAGDPLLDVARSLTLPLIAAAAVRPLAALTRAIRSREQAYLDGYRAQAESLDVERLASWRVVAGAVAVCDAYAHALSGRAGKSVGTELAIARRLAVLCEEVA